LPRGVQDQVWILLRHYFDSTLGVLWLTIGETSSVSALLGICWRKQSMSINLQEYAGLLRPESPFSGGVARTLDRIKTAMAELGYEAVMRG
jgi:hypothetical protein